MILDVFWDARLMHCYPSQHGTDFGKPKASLMRQKLHTMTGRWSNMTNNDDLERHVFRRVGGATMREDIEEALADIRPALRADGGDVELVDVKDGVVSVRLTGACGGCPMAKMTLRNGIERNLKEQVPGVREVVPVE